MLPSVLCNDLRNGRSPRVAISLLSAHFLDNTDQLPEPMTVTLCFLPALRWFDSERPGVRARSLSPAMVKERIDLGRKYRRKGSKVEDLAQLKDEPLNMSRTSLQMRLERIHLGRCWVFKLRFPLLSVGTSARPWR